MTKLNPKISRPVFPQGYLENPKTLLPWSHVEQRLTEAKNYWLCSVRPNGRPHAMPKWGVWVAGVIYVDGSPETRQARNIAKNPQVVVHLESGDDVVIVEGMARELPAPPPPDLAAQIAAEYCRKYAGAGYAPAPDQWDRGGLYEIKPQTIFAWTQFTDDPTKFIQED